MDRDQKVVRSQTVDVYGVVYEISVVAAMARCPQAWRLLLECRWQSEFWPVRHVRLHECTVVAPDKAAACRRGVAELTHVLEEEARAHP